MVKKMLIALALMLSFTVFLLGFSPLSEIVIEKFGREYTLSADLYNIESRIYRYENNDDGENAESRYFVSFFRQYESTEASPLPLRDYSRAGDAEEYLEISRAYYREDNVDFTVSGHFELKNRELGRDIMNRIARDDRNMLFSSPERWLAKNCANSKVQIKLKVLGTRFVFEEITIDSKAPEEFFRAALDAA